MRQISPTVVPPSACRSASAICSSVNADFLILELPPPLPRGFLGHPESSRLYATRSGSTFGGRAEGDVILSGQVLYPGPYALEERGETVSSLVRRAGGLTSDAYLEGTSLVRDGLPLGLDLAGALGRSGGVADLLLLPGDSLEVPQYDGTVRIIGAVEFQSRTRWREGMSLGDYLDQAGGVVEDGDRNRTVVTYANQERQRASKFLFFRSDPSIEPGSTISVPFKEQREAGGISVDVLITRYCRSSRSSWRSRDSDVRFFPKFSPPMTRCFPTFLGGTRTET